MFLVTRYECDSHRIIKLDHLPQKLDYERQKIHLSWLINVYTLLDCKELAAKVWTTIVDMYLYV